MYFQIETAGNHFVELIAPWLMIIPYRRPQVIGGTIQVLFQVEFIPISVHNGRGFCSMGFSGYGIHNANFQKYTLSDQKTFEAISVFYFNLAAALFLYLLAL